MSETITNTASLDAQEIFTEGIWLEGEKIDYAMLPKLVHRCSLSTTVEDGEVDERRYFALYNDAGTCVYVSPAMTEEQFLSDVKIVPYEPIIDRGYDRWWWNNGGSTSGGSKKKPKFPRKRKVWNDNIDRYYMNDGRQFVVAQNKRDWRNNSVVSAVQAWCNADIVKFSMKMTKLLNATAMFQNAINLEEFRGAFKSATSISRIFEGCTELNIVGFDPKYGPTGSYDYKPFNSAINAVGAFSSCVSLQDVRFIMTELKNASSMFSDCTKLKKLMIEAFGMKKMNRFCYGCTKLENLHFNTTDTTAVKFENLNNVVEANYAFANCKKLTYFPVTRMEALETGAFMFAESGLESIVTDFPALTNAESMFDKCKSLTDTPIESFSAPNVVIARRMFRDTPITTPPTSFSAVKDGLSMFQGTNITSIPCTFPSLVNARQMFYYTNISGALDLDFTTHFPNVKHRESGDEDYYGGGSYATARMFGGCPITEISFDVSTLDDGVSMFWECRRLTRCTKAVFKTGGNYQSMFTEASFDLESGQRILDAARSAGVESLHIGMNANLKSDEWIASNGLVQYEEDPSQYHTSDSKIFIKWNDPNLPIPEYIN